MDKILSDNTSSIFPSYIESLRLYLRSYQPGDANWYYSMSIKNHDHLSRYEAENVAANITSIEETKTLIGDLNTEWSKGSCFFLGAFEKYAREFVAQIYVGVVDQSLPEFEIGYFVDVNHEGKGYVTEAVKAVLGVLFNQLNAHRVHLKCDETNLRSLRVAERCGFTKEGRLRENRRNPDGTYSSSLIYGLLKSEYPGE
jgi:RimJ/RimL family protein N-acetyltransferase